MSAGRIRSETQRHGEVPSEWVLDPTIPDKTKLFYLYLSTWWNADRVFPGHERIAEAMGCSVRTVERAQADAVARGMVRVDVRPGTSNEYVLLAPKSPRSRRRTPVTSDAPPTTPVSHPPTTPVSHDRTSIDRTSLTQRHCAPTHSLTLVAQATDPDLFDAFWDVYPRHEDKKRARVAWAKAIRTTPPQVIIAKAIEYDTDPNRDPGFTKYPTTWLNGECWNDDPLPPRARSRAITDPLRRGKDARSTALIEAAFAMPMPNQRPEGRRRG